MTDTAQTDNPDIEALLDAMHLDEQVSLLSGADFWTTVAIPRLGVPPVKLTDGPNGARGAIFKDGPSTACFPVGIALAATWDETLVQAAGAALGHEARLKGARVLLGPTINLQRTVYNGRNFECHTEDPWLASAMALACVRGVQSTGVAATLKHYVGNESEFQRMSASSDIDERTLRELYLLPFERAVKAGGAMAVMTGYNRVDGVFMADHRRLVTEILRGEWGFDGLVMTDWFATHDTVDSVLAGCDLEMPGPARQRGPRLVAAVREGRLDARAVRDCARRVLRLAQRVGSFADPVIPAERSDDLPKHRALIRRLGAAGCVLLKNDAGLLPLSPQPGQTVALIGWPAVQPQIMGGGSANVHAHYRVAPIDALREACPGVRFLHAPGADLHRHIPVLAQPMTLHFHANDRLEGPVVAEHTSPSGETLWLGNGPPGVDLRRFSCRAQVRYVAETAGVHAFSLASAGLSRARLNGELVINAWSTWTRGETFFTYGCDEVVHRRAMQAGESVTIDIEFSSAVPSSRDAGVQISALRLGASRELGQPDIEAAAQLAQSADLAIVFAGLNAEWDGEGRDRPDISLPHHQNALIARVAAVQPRTVVVLQSGSPLALPWLAQVRAVLQAWYPGQECGNAIADVLLGRCDAGGRLPQTWPKSLADTVAFADPAAYPGVDGRVAYREGLAIGYRHHAARQRAPQFAFGHGLSYTEFSWSDLRVQRATPVAADPTGFDAAWWAELTVTNTGARAGDEVVQLYLSATGDDGFEAALPRPPLWLAGFARLTLMPGQRQQVRIAIPGRMLASYDDRSGNWQPRGAGHRVAVASAADAVRLTASLDA